MLVSLVSVVYMIVGVGSTPEPRPLIPEVPGVQLVEYVGVETIELISGMHYEVALQFRMRAGYHIQTNAPEDDNLIPTELSLGAPPDILIRELRYPDPVDFYIQGVSDPLQVFDETFEIRVLMDVQGGTPPGIYKLTGQLYYQACDNISCLFPRALDVVVEVQVE